MKKWIRKILVVVASLFGLVVLIGVVGFFLMRSTPSWYEHTAMTDEQREAAAQRAVNKLALVQNAAMQARVDELHSASTHPSEITISLTDDEINAFFEKWSVWQNIKESYERYFTEPAIALQDGRLILTARMKQLGAVASLQFDPQVDEQGHLNVKLTAVSVGVIPVPQKFMADYQHQAADAISPRLPAWRHRAAINSHGVANGSAISAVMGTLLVDMLNQQPADAVLFLPLIEGGSMAVKVRSVQIEDHTLTLVVEPMTAEQRTELVKRIKSGNDQ